MLLRLAIALPILLTSFFAAAPAPATACGSAVTPESGPPGTAVSATVFCGPARQGDRLQVRWGSNRALVGEATGSRDVYPVVNFQVPQNAATGEYRVALLTGGSSGQLWEGFSHTFTVTGAQPTLPPSISVSVDRGHQSSYYTGENITVCTTVSRPVIVRLTDTAPTGASIVLFQGNVANQHCVPGTVTPPAGLETIRADALEGNQVIASAQTSFSVWERSQPNPVPPPGPAPRPSPPAPPAPQPQPTPPPTDTSSTSERYLLLIGGINTQSNASGGGLVESFAPIVGNLQGTFSPSRVVYFSYSGWRVSCSSARSFHCHPAYIEADTQRPMEQHFATLTATVSDIQTESPNAQVDIVAHSQGGVVTMAWLATPEADGGAPAALISRLRSLIVLDSPLGGVRNGHRLGSIENVRQAVHALWGESGEQFFPTSTIMGTLSVAIPANRRPARGVYSIENSKSWITNGYILSGTSVFAEPYLTARCIRDLGSKNLPSFLETIPIDVILDPSIVIPGIGGIIETHGLVLNHPAAVQQLVTYINGGNGPLCGAPQAISTTIVDQPVLNEPEPAAASPQQPPPVVSRTDGAPAVPANVRVTVINPSLIRVTWNDVSNESGYRLYGGDQVSASDQTFVTGTPPNVTSVDVPGSTRNTVFCYSVAAFNTQGTSARSSPACTSAPR